MATNYRAKIYERYADHFQMADYVASEIHIKWAELYKSWLGGWLPDRKDERILDIGCGGGQFLRALGVLGYSELEGIDVSPQQISIAQKAGVNASLAEATTFLNGKICCYDIITGIDVAEHLSKDELLDFISGVHSALRPGGRIILQMPNAAGIMGMTVRYGDLTHENSMTPGCASRLLLLHGYDRIECREVGPRMRLSVPSETLRFFAWQAVRFMAKAVNFIETGGLGERVLTRVFLVSACKPSLTIK